MMQLAGIRKQAARFRAIRKLPLTNSAGQIPEQKEMRHDRYLGTLEVPAATGNAISRADAARGPRFPIRQQMQKSAPNGKCHLFWAVVRMCQLGLRYQSI